nr:gliding motility-associated C-terminal domain-containing protein [Saprospiraceae bacterium]
PLANPNNNVYLVVSVKDENNCIGYDTLFIKLTTERGIAVPTAFTPNADSNNDLLMVHGLESITVTDFLIFDRWGEMVYQYNTPFHPNNNNIGWNGQFRGKEMPSGVYVWRLEGYYQDGELIKLEGQTTLLR